MSALASGVKSNSQSGSPSFQESKPRKEMLRRCTAIVAATADKMGIGMNGSLPWKLPGDMNFFRKTTSTVQNVNHFNAVVMGRKTWESIPKKFRPLSGRVNVVLSKDDDAREKYDIPEEVLLAKSLEKGFGELNAIRHKTPIETVYVIGGGKIYEEAMNRGLCEHIYLTRIHKDGIECDTFFPCSY